jgi:hypothetical protein
MYNEHTAVRKDLVNTFRPSTPASWKKDDREWLNTYDILNGMRQYEDKYKSFKFIGAHPIDFASRFSDGTCVSAKDMCDFNAKNLLSKNYSQIAAIFNLDKHDEPGSHWVSLYIGLKPSLPNFGCFYIDSNASEIPEEINALMITVQKQMREIYSAKDMKKFAMKQSHKRFQYKNTECGMFSMFFIIQFLKKKTFSQIMKMKVDDDMVHTFRKVLYNPIVVSDRYDGIVKYSLH